MGQKGTRNVGAVPTTLLMRYSPSVAHSLYADTLWVVVFVLVGMGGTRKPIQGRRPMRRRSQKVERTNLQANMFEWGRCVTCFCFFRVSDQSTVRACTLSVTVDAWKKWQLTCESPW